MRIIEHLVTNRNDKKRNLQLDIIVYGIINAAYRKNGRKCRLTLAKEKIDTYSISQALAKNGPYTKSINQQ